MKLSEYLNMIQEIQIESNKADFLYGLIEATIRNPFSNEIIENPLDNHYNSDNSLRGIANGTKKLSRKCASEIYSLFDKDKLMDYFYKRTNNFENFKKIILSHGFLININEEKEEDIPSTLVDLLEKIIHNISQGIYETFPPLKKLDFRTLNEDAFKNIYVLNNRLYVNNQIIYLPQNCEEKDLKINHKLPYVIELLKVYSHQVNYPIKTINDLKAYPRIEAHLKEQNECYFSAIAAKRSMRDIFIDGEENFNCLEEELFHAIKETYLDFDVDDGYERLKNVLDAASKANLNSTILLNIRGLITIKEKKGICHLLVNDGHIKSWMEVDYE